MRLRFIVATRLDETAFFMGSLLAQSLETLVCAVELRIEPAFRSTAGLAAHYNPAIERSADDDLLVFIHDDVHFDDWHLPQRLAKALGTYDVAGVAGAVSREPRQVAWWATEREGQLVATGPGTQSGAIKHVKPRRRTVLARLLESGLTHLPAGRRDWRQRWLAQGDGTYARVAPPVRTGPPPSLRHAGSAAGRLDVFGPAPQRVVLLDGVLLAARADRLKASSVRFDPRFGYHFYDLDFCRQCAAAGLAMGTWPLSITHASLGNWGDSWRAGRDRYLDKWPD